MSGSYGYTNRQSSASFAGWGSRVVASILDSVPTIAVFFVVLSAFGTSDTSDPSSKFQPSGQGMALYYLFAIVWFFYNVVYRQGRTGQTIGKSMLGITLGRAGTAEPIGAGRSFVRQIAHILDAIPCYLGFLWPLGDREKRTFADMIMSTRVYHKSTLGRY